MADRFAGAPLLLALLTACGGGGGGGAGSTAAALSTPVLTGRVLDAPAGATVILLERDPAARDLVSLMATFLDGDEADAAGRFTLTAPPAGTEADLVVLAPGRALLRVSAAEAGPTPLLALEPEAALTLRLRDEGGQALAEVAGIALGPDGVPLPLPAEGLISDASGQMQVRCLPPGRVILLLSAADGDRYARVELDLAPGQAREEDVTLTIDPALQRQLALAVGGETAELAGAIPSEEAQ